MAALETLLMDVDEDLTPTEREILEMLEEGRCSPAYIAEEIGRSQEHVRARIHELERLGLVDKVYRGLYELADE